MSEYCNGKVIYNKKTAQTVRNKRLKQGMKLRVYYHTECNGWHLTRDLHKPDFKYKKGLKSELYKRKKNEYANQALT